MTQDEMDEIVRAALLRELELRELADLLRGRAEVGEGASPPQYNKAEVVRVLQDLPPQDQRLLIAIFFEERAKDEVCQEMGVDANHFRVLLQRAKFRFREAFRRRGATA